MKKMKEKESNLSPVKSFYYMDIYDHIVAYWIVFILLQNFDLGISWSDSFDKLFLKHVFLGFCIFK